MSVSVKFLVRRCNRFISSGCDDSKECKPPMPVGEVCTTGSAATVVILTQDTSVERSSNCWLEVEFILNSVIKAVSKEVKPCLIMLSEG